MSTSNFLSIKQSDLENGIGINTNNNLPLTPTKLSTESSTIVKLNNDSITIESSNCAVNCCMKFTVWFIIMIFTFPIMFCDLYYGYTDNTCVNEPAGKLLINLKDYLVVSGWVMMSFLSGISIGLAFIDFDSFNENMVYCGFFGTIIMGFIGIFLLIWNIIGAVIFWSLMDTSECSKNIYNYVFASLIIKLVFNAIGLLNSKNKDKK